MNYEEFAYLAANNLHIFPKFASGYKVPRHGTYIGKLIQKAVSEQHLEENRHKKHKVFLVGGPPRHGKSDLLCVHGSAWIMGVFPRKKILIASYQTSLSHDHTGRARVLFEQWSEALWGVKPDPRVFSSGNWRTEFGGGVRGVGIQAGASGYGSDILLIDDYHKDSLSAESKLQRDNNWEWWTSAAIERLHPGGIVVVYATRWHGDDLCGRIIKQAEEFGDEAPFEVHDIRFPALAEENDVLGREPGEALWPWWKDEYALNNIKKAVGPHMWACLFQASPRLREGSLFNPENFRYYDYEPSTGCYVCYRDPEEDPVRINQKELIRHVYVDPSLEIKKSNDPMCALAWGYSRRHKVWLLLDRLHGRIEHTKVHGALMSFGFKTKSTVIGCENEKIGKILVKNSAGKDNVGGASIPFREVPTGGVDKYARATPMATYIENGRVFFPRSAPWLTKYEDGLTSFPRGDHDEDVDCTSMARLMEAKMSVTEVLMHNVGK